MQLIAEAYDILKRGLGLHEDEIAAIFDKWNKGVLDSFLIEITANILKFKDDDGEPLVTKILDQAGQKGTGKWTAIAALDAGTAGQSSSFITGSNLSQCSSISHPYRRSRLCSLSFRNQSRAYPC
jgi:6-phosphogluconate dehydrogenase